ncbi:MAG: hypothetical protein OXH72_15080 [Caldilineaceae bacterium]|nr:hypothetical protein [Caldilineaceae bacterium]
MQVRFDLSLVRVRIRHAVVAAVSCACVLTGLLGFAVTAPMETPRVLVPARWKALQAKLAVQGEVEGLAVDLAYLVDLLREGSSDSVQVTLVAQRLRARYREGEPATAAARAAVVAAAETAVREVQGAASPREVVAALENARVKLNHVTQP